MVKLYVEGGTQDSALDRSLCRQAFSRFFAGDPRLKGKLPRTVPCGGRKAAYDAFLTAVKNPRPQELPLLLVDSESPVSDGITVWQHLARRVDDNWEKPETVNGEQAFLMVQVMETWFIADRPTLLEFFGPNFRPNAIPKWQNLEQVPKADIYGALQLATAACGQKTYSKGNLSFALLAQISPVKVQESSPHARALFDQLASI